MKKIISVLLSICLAVFVLGCNKQASKNATAIDGESKIVRLYIGQEGSFTNTEYSYVSDNSSVLKITGNSYKGLSEGSASVTVKDTKKGAVAVYLFVVFGNQPVALESLNVEGIPQNNSLTVGQTVKLSYAKNPINADKYDAIVWKSNSDAVTVDKNGNVTANKMGQATITVSALGTDIYREVTINVLPRDTVFSLNYNKIVGVEGKTEAILIADVLTDYPIDEEVSWFSNDEETVTVSNGELTFVKEGKTEVGIRAKINGEDLETKCSVTVVKDQGFTVIRTPEQLQEIGNTSGNYMLGNDIDMQKACEKGGSLYNDGKGFMPLFENAKNSFKGIFEGNGFAIKNLIINRPNDTFVAFMRYISAEEGNEGRIQNLSIIGGNVKGGNYTSVFYSNSSGYGNINSGLRNCYAELNLESVGSLSCLVGNNKGVVENCISNVTFDSLGDTYLFALNHTGTKDGLGVKNCVFIGEAGETEFANLENGGEVSNCYAVGKDEIGNFDFELGDGWSYTAGQIPTVKGV